MAHKHSVYDTDTHFQIDGVTRSVRNVSSTKTMLVQHDHNSERFTFEIPRRVDGHDMSACNVVQVHYNNIDSGMVGQQYSGIYEVNDLQISPDSNDVVICSWLVSANATQYVGQLPFILRFACVSTDGTIEYAWNTAIHSGVSVVSGICNSEVVAEEYADILEQWKQELIAAGAYALAIDKTLMVEGEAADARAAGDAIRAVDGKVDPLVSEIDGMRTGYDGTTYTTAGEAVRTQIRNVKADNDTIQSTLNTTAYRVVTESDLNWMEGWEAPNHADAAVDVSRELNLKNSHVRRMSTTPFWFPAGARLTRNDAFYTAIDDASVDSDGAPARIMVSMYDPKNAAHPWGWVRLLYETIAGTPAIVIEKAGWYVLSVTHGTANANTVSFGQPYVFSYKVLKGEEPNYVFTKDWGTFYNVRGANVSQPAFSNGLNWACRREPGHPYYLDNQGYGSEYNRGGYKTTDLTLNTKKGSSVAGIMSYKDEIWTFFTADDDLSSLGSVTKFKIYDNKWIKYVGRCWVNAGHVNSIHYEPITDTVVFGNGSTSYTMEGKAYLLNNFSESALAKSYNDEICLLNAMGVDTVSLPIATYGFKANAIPVGVDYYEGKSMSLIVALLTNDGNTLRYGHIKGTEELKPQFRWNNCVWDEPINIGDITETQEQSYPHCVQDMTVWQGDLIWGEGHNENRYAKAKLSPGGESVRESRYSATLPKSNIHAVTAHCGRLFASGLNMFCLIDPFAGMPVTLGTVPVEIVVNPGGGEEDPDIPGVVDTNLWSISDKTATVLPDGGASVAKPIKYDEFYPAITVSGSVSNLAKDAPIYSVSGENITLTCVAHGFGLCVPLDLVVGGSYKLRFKTNGAGRIYATYYDANGLYATYEALTTFAEGGTYTKTFSVQNYKYFLLHFRVENLNEAVVFSDIEVTAL